MTVQELVSRLSFKTDNGSLQRAHSAIKSVGAAFDKLQKKLRGQRTRDEKGRFEKGIGGFQLPGIAKAYIGFRGLELAGRALIGFNADVEETKNQIAGMLSLSKGTDLSAELENANKLYAGLQKRAAKLPGTTAEYAAFASRVTRSITSAGLGMQDLEDITVNAVVAAKAFGEEADVAARDIDQLLSGRYNTTDPFSMKLLGGMMVNNISLATEKGRALVRKMSMQQRADLLKTALARKQIDQLAAAQGDTLRGKWSTIVDTMQQTAGKIGKPIFDRIKQGLDQAVAWIDANQDKIDAFAQQAAEVITEAFDGVVSWFRDNWDLIVLTLKGVGFAIVGIVKLVLGFVAVLRAIGTFVGRAAGFVVTIVQRWLALFDKFMIQVMRVGRAFGAVFAGVGQFVIGVFDFVGSRVRAIVEWITGKVAWVTDKISWISDKLGSVFDVADFDQLRNQVATRESTTSSGGTTAPLTNLVINNQINANGLNADQAKALVDSRLTESYRDAAATLGAR